MLEHLFDSHAHYDDAAFDCDRDTLLPLLPASGVQHIVNVASDRGSVHTSQALAEKYPFIYCAVGFHPHNAKDFQAAEDLSRLREAYQKPKTVAIGEIGLDYHYDFSPRAVQQHVFRQQLELARELDAPVIIHSREATADTLTLLEEFQPRGIVHCFSGSAETARQILRLGMYLGFTGVVTFKNAKKALEAVAVTPLERLLIETDCPYMAPTPHRGKRSDSRMLPYTVATIAALKGVGEQELADITQNNARRIYGLEKDA